MAQVERSSLANPKPVRRGPKPRARIARRTPIRRGAPPKRTSRPHPIRQTPTAADQREADKLWSAVVLKLADHKCEACNLLGWRIRRATDAAHVFSRRCLTTRHMPQNGVALCRRCHDRLGSAVVGRETRMSAFYRELRGTLTYDCLERLAREVGRFDIAVLRMLRNQACVLGVAA